MLSINNMALKVQGVLQMRIQFPSSRNAWIQNSGLGFRALGFTVSGVVLM